MLNVKTIELLGLDGKLVEVEVQVTGGKPQFFIIGLPDAAIKEAIIRVITAFKNSRFRFPYDKKVIVNLAPGDIKKEGASYDMAIAIGILLSTQEISHAFNSSIMIGELSLNGTFRHVQGVLTIADVAKRQGFTDLYLPAEDAAEASFISGLRIYPVQSLRELYEHMSGERPIVPITSSTSQPYGQEIEYQYDMQYIRGQARAKRALEIASSGMHNILMSGPPGSGKTLLAKTAPSIMPALTQDEVLEVSKIYSVAGLLSSKKPLIYRRPHRSPHHSSSPNALIGGGRVPKPGEVSLAHRGVLFLDEFPEFPRQTLEMLRQPLEDGEVTISRVEATLRYPARFMLIASQNPCPCGFSSDPGKECVCTPRQIIRYKQKISGPIMDRIDLHIEVPRLSFDEMNTPSRAETSEEIRKRVERTRQIQLDRFTELPVQYNAEMQSREIKTYCALDAEGTAILKQAMEQMDLSPRSYYRMLRVSRTIADLAEAESIQAEHIAEALHYRFGGR